MDFKSFEVVFDMLKGCFHGGIVGRGRGMSNWVRFGEINLAYLLDGVFFFLFFLQGSGWEEDLQDLD